MDSMRYRQLFADFVESEDTLRIYRGGEPVFTSGQNRLLPIVEYLDKVEAIGEKVTIFDKIMGNAAALLAVKAGGEEVYSPLGSEIATGTLKKFGIPYHLTEIVPFIQRPDGGMCPMEKMSLGKSPEEFYTALKALIEAKS
jgi:hypothetical protein